MQDRVSNEYGYFLVFQNWVRENGPLLLGILIVLMFMMSLLYISMIDYKMEKNNAIMNERFDNLTKAIKGCGINAVDGKCYTNEKST